MAWNQSRWTTGIYKKSWKAKIVESGYHQCQKQMLAWPVWSWATDPLAICYICQQRGSDASMIALKKVITRGVCVLICVIIRLKNQIRVRQYTEGVVQNSMLASRDRYDILNYKYELNWVRTIYLGQQRLCIFNLLFQINCEYLNRLYVTKKSGMSKNKSDLCKHFSNE